MSKTSRTGGGYRKLYSYNFAVIIHLATINFYKRFITDKEGDQDITIRESIQVSRAAKQNMSEGSEQAKISAEAEIQLLHAARVNLCELTGNFEDYLISRGHIPWSVHEKDYRELFAVNLANFEYSDDLLHDYWKYLLNEQSKFDRWLKSGDGIMVANALIVLTQRSIGALTRQLEKLRKEVIPHGDKTERIKHVEADFAVAENKIHEEATPVCPECQAPMRKRNSSRGEFWGCSKFPECRGVRKTTDTQKT